MQEARRITAANFLAPVRMRYRALDGYRFIAAICVVVYHFNSTFALGLERWTPAVSQFNLMVDFFFLLSGFVIATSYGDRMRNFDDYSKFMRARFARLYPLHLLTTAAMAGLGLVYFWQGQAANHPETALIGLPATLTLLHATGILHYLPFNLASWSISAEFCAYALVPLLFFAVRKAGCILALGLALVFLLAEIALRNAGHLRPWNEATFDYGAMRALPTFLSGIAIAAAMPFLIQLARVPWPVAHSVFVLVLLAMHWQMPPFVSLVLLALLIVACAIAEIGDARTVIGGPLMGRLGDASYAIYMLHQLVAIAAMAVLDRYSMTSTLSHALAALATLCVTLALADASFRRFETPMRHWLTQNKRASPQKTQEA